MAPLWTRRKICCRGGRGALLTTGPGFLCPMGGEGAGKVWFIIPFSYVDNFLLSGHQSHMPGIIHLPTAILPSVTDLLAIITYRKWLSDLKRGRSKWPSNHKGFCSSDWTSSAQLLKWPFHSLVPHLIKFFSLVLAPPPEL